MADELAGFVIEDGAVFLGPKSDRTYIPLNAVTSVRFRRYRLRILLLLACVAATYALLLHYALLNPNANQWEREWGNEMRRIGLQGLAVEHSHLAGDEVTSWWTAIVFLLLFIFIRLSALEVKSASSSLIRAPMLFSERGRLAAIAIVQRIESHALRGQLTGELPLRPAG